VTVHAPVTMNITVFLDVTPHCLVEIYRHFRGTCYLEISILLGC